METELVKNCRILIGCFLVQFLLSGSSRLSSIYYVESMTRYDVGRKEASFPFVLIFVLKNLIGPVLGFLEPLIGIKWIIVIGCVMSTLGIGACFFAEDILAITVLWGVIFGLSYGFAQNMQAPLLNQHFKHSKNKANGFVCAGSSLGGALLPLLASECIKIYGTSGSFLILSAVIAHSIPASLLLENQAKKTVINNVENENREGNKSNIKTNTCIVYTSDNSNHVCMEKTNGCLSNCNDDSTHFSDLSAFNSPLNNIENNGNLANALNTADAYMKQTSRCLSSCGSENTYSEDLSTSNLPLNNIENNKTLDIVSNTADVCMEQTNRCLSSFKVENTYSKDRSVFNSPLNDRENNEPLGSVSNTANHLSKDQNQKYILNSNVKNKTFENAGTLNSSLNKITNKKEHRKSSEKTKVAFRTFRVFTDPTFIIILIFNGIKAVIIVTVWTIILDFIRDKKVPVHLEIYYVMMLPLTDILGRLGAGYIADKSFLSFPQLCYITFSIEAAALFSIVYINNFMLLMACEIVISIGFGMLVVLQITMVDKFMAEELKTMALSCRVMLYVPLSFTISPMIGFFRGGYGSYDKVFYILSGASVFCECLVWILTYLAKKPCCKNNNSHLEHSGESGQNRTQILDTLQVVNTNLVK